MPRDSEAEGVISLRAFVKFDRERVRDGGGSGAEGRGDCASVSDGTEGAHGRFGMDGVGKRLDVVSSELVVVRGTFHGSVTRSLTASKAADTHKSLVSAC